MVKIIDDSSFDSEVLQSGKPVLVDFFASWCGPCKMLAPIIEELESDPIGEEVDFAKLDIDIGRDTASRFSVMSVPTMILFENGMEQARLVGVQSKGMIESVIRDAAGL